MNGLSISYGSDHIWQFQIKNNCGLGGYRLPSISFMKRKKKKGIKSQIRPYKLPGCDLLMESRGFFLLGFFVSSRIELSQCGEVWAVCL